MADADDQDFHECRGYYLDAAEGKRPLSDFTWYALDAAGQIAALGSAGFGWVPESVFQGFDSFYLTMRYFETVSSSSTWIADHPPELQNESDYASDVKQYGSGGLFVYDFSTIDIVRIDPDECPYRRVLKPSTPLIEDALPSDVRKYVSAIRFRGFKFDEACHLWIKESFSEVR